MILTSFGHYLRFITMLQSLNGRQVRSRFASRIAMICLTSGTTARSTRMTSQICKSVTLTASLAVRKTPRDGPPTVSMKRDSFSVSFCLRLFKKKRRTVKLSMKMQKLRVMKRIKQ